MRPAAATLQTLLSPAALSLCILLASACGPASALRAPSPALSSRSWRSTAFCGLFERFSGIVHARFGPSRREHAGVRDMTDVSADAVTSNGACLFEAEMLQRRAELAPRVLAIASDPRRNGGTAPPPGPVRLIVLAHGLAGTEEVSRLPCCRPDLASLQSIPRAQRQRTHLGARRIWPT